MPGRFCLFSRLNWRTAGFRWVFCFRSLWYPDWDESAELCGHWYVLPLRLSSLEEHQQLRAGKHVQPGVTALHSLQHRPACTAARSLTRSDGCLAAGRAPAALRRRCLSSRLRHLRLVTWLLTLRGARELSAPVHRRAAPDGRRRRGSIGVDSAGGGEGRGGEFGRSLRRYPSAGRCPTGRESQPS